LRQRETTHTPVVVMTASSREGDVQEYLQAGADQYLSKPIQEEQLLAALHSVLTQKPEITCVSSEILDADALGERLHYKMERLARLSQLFQQVLPEHLSEIRAALEQRNPKELERCAHRYKMTLGSIEARRSLAQQLEIMGREERWEGSAEVLEQLCEESEQIKQRLDQLLVEAAVLAQL
jgi:DNA-binding response OmpR family regulator